MKHTIFTMNKLWVHIADFIDGNEDGASRILIVGRQKDFVVTVRAVKKKKLRAYEGKPTQIWFDEQFDQSKGEAF